MFAALSRAVSALSMPPLRQVVALSLALAMLTFTVLWAGIAGFLYDTTFFGWRPLNWLLDLLGGLAVLALTWFCFRRLRP